MPINEVYQVQVRLLMRLLPIVAQEDCFALKGGTAINLFFRNLARLSVDIDLMYLPMRGRPDALAGIDAAMKRIEAQILEDLPGAHVAQTVKEGAVLRLVAHSGLCGQPFQRHADSHSGVRGQNPCGMLST